MATSAGNQRVGWIGTGIMGTSMCSHLMVRSSADTEIE
jgi:3-hydroxyisobutyrate dehydrogenase-like beta-hydroxyacid dehydrogenase